MRGISSNANGWIFSYEKETIYNSSSFKRNRPIIAIDKEGNESIFSNQKEAEKITGAKQSNINRVLKGKRKQSNGYYFKYKD